MESETLSQTFRREIVQRVTRNFLDILVLRLLLAHVAASPEEDPVLDHEALREDVALHARAGLQLDPL